MFRLRSSAAAGLIAVVTIAALLPGVCALEYALFEPLWVLLPDMALRLVDEPVVVANEQPLPLLSLSPSRAPPVSL
jgi:hypothetical protein